MTGGVEFECREAAVRLAAAVCWLFAVEDAAATDPSWTDTDVAAARAELIAVWEGVDVQVHTVLCRTHVELAAVDGVELRDPIESARVDAPMSTSGVRPVLSSPLVVDARHRFGGDRPLHL